MLEMHRALQFSDLETRLFLDAIIAHMAFIDAEDLRSRIEAHAKFVEAIKILNCVLCEPACAKHVDYKR
ncbi:MAG: hypothetical protein JST11_05290 [Acidobacteria bacterium]|nr:hypothetical protein [Acidobacteriota bacterium]